MDTLAACRFLALATLIGSCAAQTQPKLVQSSPPGYPERAEVAGHQGVVHLSVAVSKEGTVSDTKVTKSSRSEELDHAAVVAVRNWKFVPATDASGNTTEVRTPVELAFQRPHRFVDSRKPCQDLVVEFDWLKTAHPETGLNRRQLLIDEFVGLIRRPFGDPQANQKLDLELVQKLELALAECRRRPSDRARDVIRELVRNEPYYRQ